MTDIEAIKRRHEEHSAMFTSGQEYLSQPVLTGLWDFAHQDRATLLAEVERLGGQLPEGMKHCTIRLKECRKGHGWLTAKNWIQHGCPTCRAEAAEKQLEQVRGLADKWDNKATARSIQMDQDNKRRPIKDLRICADELRAIVGEAE